MSRKLWIVALIAALFLSLVFAVGHQTREPGSLDLIILDGTGGQPTPARVELLDSEKKSYVADDALPTQGDAQDRAEALRIPLEEAVGLMSKALKNPYTNRTEFYSTGSSKVSSLQAGSYRLRIHKGPEFKVYERLLEIRRGEQLKVTVELSRWIDLARQGWYSADDHLHIARPVEGLNPIISKWMQAEDVRVANLLQFGNARVSHNSLQYEFGEGGQYREGNYLLATGQENPRSHFLGHTIVLGTKSLIHFPSNYLIYRNFFAEAKRQGALNGYAHWGTWAGAQYGLAIDLPFRLLNFLEILQRGDEEWQVWYDILNSGFRLTPTAGTDFPIASLPGRERFYTKVDGSLTYAAWLEGVQQGRTFVTNGPMLEFRVAGKDMGGEVMLERPGAVTVEARVRFDPQRDDVKTLELIENGHIVRSIPRLSRSSEISLHVSLDIRESSWLAVRSLGQTLDEASYFSAKSLAHSAPIYVTLKDAPRLEQSPLGKITARTWLARLDDIEARLAPDQLPYLAVEPHAPKHGRTDGVEEAVLRRDRAAILENIGSARADYLNRLADDPDRTMLRPNSGTVVVDGRSIHQMSDRNPRAK